MYIDEVFKEVEMGFRREENGDFLPFSIQNPDDLVYGKWKGDERLIVEWLIEICKKKKCSESK